ncbi:caspase domain-containing protein [Radiomyces spectabilis]|uniref:caspase domain-containing protein n=1 Tax=Radiomyces spectabilis TaxID=64574 RepID=UPI00221E797A|nr:caspase domain-containing protein [Radiomyces spectabilis]KAI8376291.1 caspase domain-containing protein [Radiomyces spectabilis]
MHNPSMSSWSPYASTSSSSIQGIPIAARPLPPPAPTEKNKRTRITRACDICRRKKIKCDVKDSQPCSTCRQYGWECTFNDTAKKRGPPKGYIESLETRLKKMEQLVEQMHSNNGSPGTSESPHKRQRSMSSSPEAAPYMLPSASSSSSATHSPQPPVAGQTKDKIIRYHGSSSGFYIVGDILNSKEGEPSNGPERQSPTSGTHETAVGESQQSVPAEKDGENSKLFTIPSNQGTYRLRRMNVYDDDLMVVRDTTDAEHASQLASNEQETINYVIPRRVLEALVYMYFRMPHPTLPVVDKDEYLDAFEGRTSPAPSPLLTYAIAVYACFLLNSDNPIFVQANVERDSILRALLERTSELVRREYLVPRISNIRALVLLCAQPTSSTTGYRNWILAGMAVRMAQDLGLHRSLTTCQVSEQLIESRKRLWYSVYLTDRWCCAVMGRPLAIADSDCDIDLPMIHGANNDADYTVFVNFTKLSGILGEVLRRIYSPKAKINGYKTVAMEQTVWSLERMLTEWFLQIPENYRISPEDLELIRRQPEKYQDTVKLREGGPLTVCYYAVIVLLLRPFIALEGEDSKSELCIQSVRKCMNAAKASIDVARVVPTVNICRFGWNFAAYSVFQAALIHVYNCTSSDPEVATMAREYVRLSMDECMIPLCEDVPYSPPIVAFMQTLFNLLRADPASGKSSAEHEKKSDNTTMPPPRPTSSQTSNFSSSPSSSGISQPPSHYENASPMSMHQLVSGLDGPKQEPSATMKPNPTTAPPAQPAQGTATPSWLSTGDPLPASAAVTQATWQQLFSSAGTPFTENANGFDLQVFIRFLFLPLSMSEQNYYYNHGYPPPPPPQNYVYQRNGAHGYEDPASDYYDPMFTQEDMQNPNPNYPQPPLSAHNPAPYPVPYGEGQTDASNSQFFLHVHPALKDKPPPDFRLSNCQGKKRALLIGINYFGTSNELNGCINDVHNVKEFLTTLYGFDEADMVILTDDQTDPKFIPTRANIVAGMQWLVHDCQPNDSFFFHYSGHGGRVHDTSGDEDDGFDETIYPVDFTDYEGDSGQLIDDDMHDLLVKPLCQGCRLTAIFDSCHSGTALDLPYVYSTQGVIKEKNLFKDAGVGLLSAGFAYVTGDKQGALSSIMSLGKQLMSARDVAEENREKNSSPADVIMFSGCKDDQTSADAQEAGKATGAMSHAFTSKSFCLRGSAILWVSSEIILSFLAALRENPHQSYQQLLNTIRDILRDKYSQRPQLSSSHPIDVDLQFVC